MRRDQRVTRHRLWGDYFKRQKDSRHWRPRPGLSAPAAAGFTGQHNTRPQREGSATGERGLHFGF